MKTLILLLYWPLVATLIALLSAGLFRRGVRRGWIFSAMLVCLAVAEICVQSIAQHLQPHGAVVRAALFNAYGWPDVLSFLALWTVTYGLFFFLLGKLAPGLLCRKCKVRPVGGE
jgi:hypothetical protein